MSTSQRLLFAHLLLLLGGPSTGCNGENEYSTDTYCIDIEAAEECPTVEEMNDTVFPTGWQCGGGSHMWAQEFIERCDDPVWYWGDTGPEAQDFDSCCYDTAHRKTLRRHWLRGRTACCGGGGRVGVTCGPTFGFVEASASARCVCCRASGLTGRVHPLALECLHRAL